MEEEEVKERERVQRRGRECSALLNARAAHLLSSGCQELMVMLELHETHRHRTRGQMSTRTVHGLEETGLVARAALLLSRRFIRSSFTGRLLALEFALRLRTECRFVAFPITLRLLAERRADRFGCDAARPAFRRCTHRLTLRTILLLAEFLRTADTALRLLTLHGAFGSWERLALHLAAGAFTDRMALRRAGRIITQPFACRMTLLLLPREGEERKKN